MSPLGGPDNERIRWAACAVEAMADGEDPPEPPESVKEERERRRRDRRARKAQRRAVAEGAIEDVPPDERCMGLGPRCVMCGSELPGPGDPPRRCDRLSTDDDPSDHD